MIIFAAGDKSNGYSVRKPTKVDYNAMIDNLFKTNFEHLLDSLKVMTIATPWENGVWSAPVYYLYKHGAFWFFSSPDSRHIIGSKRSPDMMVAASIFMDHAEFNNIRGIQMRGKIEESFKGDIDCNVSDGVITAASYIKKFSIPFKGTDMADALTLIQQRYRSKLYRFVPTEIIYMDNSIHIGFKQKVELSKIYK